ncbi:MAG: hypothetical protein DCF32_22625 [Leptolyngbya sp.]|nr:MAG: hypothetical protein DCF32_22625 [Leptolyngbya sp.]
MDENVYGAIANGLRQRQIAVLPVQENNRSGIADPKILFGQILARSLGSAEGRSHCLSHPVLNLGKLQWPVVFGLPNDGLSLPGDHL